MKPPSLPTLVKMPVSCGKRPVKIDERDGQQSESVTQKLANVSPSFCIWTTCGMYWTRFKARSSVRMKTMFGRLVLLDGGGGRVLCAGAAGGLAGNGCPTACADAL